MQPVGVTIVNLNLWERLSLGISPSEIYLHQPAGIIDRVNADAHSVFPLTVALGCVPLTEPCKRLIVWHSQYLSLRKNSFWFRLSICKKRTTDSGSSREGL